MTSSTMSSEAQPFFSSPHMDDIIHDVAVVAGCVMVIFIVFLLGYVYSSSLSRLWPQLLVLCWCTRLRDDEAGTQRTDDVEFVERRGAAGADGAQPTPSSQSATAGRPPPLPFVMVTQPTPTRQLPKNAPPRQTGTSRLKVPEDAVATEETTSPREAPEGIEAPKEAETSAGNGAPETAPLEERQETRSAPDDLSLWQRRQPNRKPSLWLELPAAQKLDVAGQKLRGRQPQRKTSSATSEDDDYETRASFCRMMHEEATYSYKLPDSLSA